MKVQDKEVRLGFGIPVTLTGDEADKVRRFLDLMPTNTRMFCSAPELNQLHGLFLPPPPECARAREIIRKAAEHIGGVAVWPQIDDPDYEARATELGASLQAAETAYKEKPAGCEMTADANLDSFDCDRCHFNMVVYR